MKTAAAAALCLGLLTACGGGTTTAAGSPPTSSAAPAPAPATLDGRKADLTKWTSSLCIGVIPIIKDEKAAQTDATSSTGTASSSATDDPSFVRTRYLNAISAVQVDFQQAHDIMGLTGQPDVAAGDQIQLGVLKAFQTGADSFAAAAMTLKNASAADAAAVGAALTQASTTLNSGGSAALDAIGKAGSLDTTGAITKAGTANPDCASLLS